MAEGNVEEVAPYIRAEGMAPIFVSTNVEAALARYATMGFAVREHREGAQGPVIYGFICYGPGEFHIARVDRVNMKKTTSAAYLYVEDVDNLYSKWSALDIDGTWHPPVDTPYGLREAGYVDPDGNLIRVGSPLRQ